VNVTKAKLKGLFADELTLLQPTPGYARRLKESVLQIWTARNANIAEENANAEVRNCASWLRTIEDGNESMVDQTGASWNRVVLWMRQLESLRRVS
jgi:hypothetical protein